jgi:Na+/proline symporter
MNSVPGFATADWVVLVAYFLGITALGLWVARRVKDSKSYFLGNQQLPWWIMIGQAFGTGTHAENPVAQAGASYQAGFATIWYQWKNMLVTPFYWLMAPWYRRSERTTVAEIIGDRYGRGMELVYTVFALAFFVFNQGAMLKGAAKVISIATGGELISPNGVIVVMTVAFIAYSFFGGLVASAYTDFVQGLLIIVLSFMLIPPGLEAVGGTVGMREKLPDHFFTLFSGQSGLGLATILLLTLNGVIGITAMPHQVSMNASGRTERAGRIGQTYGTVIKRVCTIGWAFTGLIVAAMLFEQPPLKDPEEAFGYATRTLLGPGFVGLMVACILAANMSTCSNFMVNTGALFTRNVYQRYIDPQAKDTTVVKVGRFSGLALTFLGVLFALVVDQVLHAFLFTETIAAFMGIMFLGGMLWPRANRHGALGSTLAAFLTYYVLMFAGTGELKLVYPWSASAFGWAMLAGAAAFVVLSLMTGAEDTRQFFRRLQSSSDRDSPSPDGQELILVDATTWFTRARWAGFVRRYREDAAGFLIAWIVVAALVAFAWAFIRAVGS